MSKSLIGWARKSKACCAYGRLGELNLWAHMVDFDGVDISCVLAVFHATGRRIRELPITPDKLL